MKRNLTSKDFPIKGKGPNGRNLCRICGDEVPKGRRTLCSPQCEEKINILTNSNYARRKVKERDKGVCSACGLDTVKLKRILWKVAFRDYRIRFGKEAYSKYTAWHYLSKTENRGRLFTNLRLKYRWVSYMKHLWEADHIQPVSRGGTGELENLQTLCIPCHKKKTREMHEENAKNRR